MDEGDDLRLIITSARGFGPSFFYLAVGVCHDRLVCVAGGSSGSLHFVWRLTMNFKRMVATAIARRVAYVVVAFLLVALGIGNVRAATRCGILDGMEALAAAGSSLTYPTEGEAFAACQAMPNFHSIGGGVVNDIETTHCTVEGTKMRAWHRFTGLRFNSTTCAPMSPGSTAASGSSSGWTFTSSCSAQSDGQFNWNASIWGDLQSHCDNGCLRTHSDTQCFVVSEGPNPGQWCNALTSTTGATCDEGNEPPDDPEAPEECPAGTVRLPDGSCGEQGDCPVGQHLVNGECQPNGACPTGQVKAPDGSCVDESCPAGQARGADGSCKPDDDEDGEPDEGEDDGTFSGGESCDVPPLCSGDNILCGQARIQWRIDCNTRKNRHISGGHCGIGGMPICTGEKCDALEYASLLTTWRIACALEDESAGGGVGDVDLSGVEDRLDGIQDYLDGNGQSVGDSEVPWSDAVPVQQEWSSGLGGGTCPAPVTTTVSILGTSAPIELSFEPLCMFAGYLYYLVIAMSLVTGSFIVAAVRR